MIYELIELNIESIAFEGASIARKDGKVYFVKGGVPGDKVLARIVKKKSKHNEAKVEQVIEPSEFRIEPECIHFGVCGGCSWQNLTYEQQLIWKKRHVADAFERIGKVLPEDIRDTLPADRIYNYRNKMEFSFGSSRWLTDGEIENTESIENKNFALGLYIPGRNDKILDINECKIQPATGNEVLSTIRKAALHFGCKPYSLLKHAGFLRSVIIRSSLSENELMIIFITTSEKEEQDRKMIKWYESEFPNIFPNVANIIHATNDSYSPVAGGGCNNIKGKGYLTENILGINYKISPFSFFQTNSSQLNKFISIILKMANIKKEHIIWDLYCGTGSISLPAAKMSKKVYGMEFSNSSVEDARNNAKLNNIDNCEFLSMDLHDKKGLENLNILPKPDTIILDPPRAGLHNNLVEYLMNLQPVRIVYVSCNPATQARDCGLLAEKYVIKKVQPVDMFPQTYHVESVALLEIKG